MRGQDSKARQTSQVSLKGDTMRNSIATFAFLVALSGPQHLFAGPRDVVPISYDAVILALAHQKTGVFLDSALAIDIDRALKSSRAILDTLNSIHPRPGSDAYKLLIGSSATWTTAWKSGMLRTGNRFIDSLSDVYSLDTVYVLQLGTSFLFTLKYRIPLHSRNLAKIYLKDPTIAYAEPDGYCCDGDNVEIVKKGGTWDLAFSRGLGDCPAGCTYRYYWYVGVDSAGATFVGEGGTDHSKAIIYRWNFPPSYDPTYFSSLTSLLDQAQHAGDWWVRQFAVESLGRLFMNTPPSNRIDQFQSLRNDAIVSKAYCAEVLRGLVNDTDPEVQNSAILVLGSLVGSERGYSSYFPLHVGNSWTWSRPIGANSIETITDTAMDGNTKYYRFNHLRELDTPLVTIDDRYARVIAHSSIVKWLDFSLNPGDTYEVRFFTIPLLAWTVRIGNINDTVHFGNRLLTHCWRFDMEVCCDWGWSEWFAPGIGPVKRVAETIHGPDTYWLVSARIDGSTIVSSVEEEGPKGRLEFSLAHNYPNPFNPSTAIRFSVPTKSRVRLSVFNLLGQRIAELANEEIGPGSYERSWNANVASGMYFYRLEAVSVTDPNKRFVDVKKMVLVK